MEYIYKKARAKINLNLIIVNKREDNYHNIKSIFQKINLYDEIYIEKNISEKFILETNVEELNNKQNIVYKAYEILKEKYKNITGVKVILNKNIPMQAGLAGGSTDCASFIICMNKLFELKMKKEEIERIAKSLGADVIPCLYNKALIAEGIGDIITKINTNFKYYIVIIKPEINCNTGVMYKRIDEKNNIKQIDNSNKLILSLENNNIEMLTNNLYNVFEYAMDKKDEIEEIKENLKNHGALGSLMTGSGSCVYGIFKNKEDAKFAYKKLKNKYKTYICTSYNSTREDLD